MTTRKFSTIKLPHPKYSLNVGKFNLTDLEEQLKYKSTCQTKNNNDISVDREHTSLLPAAYLPRFTHLTQLVEVKKTGHASLEQSESHLRQSLGSHLLIENVRPALFIRRDFITKFVDKGVIHLSHVSGGDNQQGYRLSSRNNVMIITMNAKQYHRFGLVAKKVKCAYGKKRVHYKIEIDLKNELIKTSNKYQDKLMLILKRLNSINKIYFRFDPSKLTDISVAAANELSEDYFNYVINEYAQDGCQPVPLTGCRKVSQTIQKSWLNCSQLHPKLDLNHSEIDNNSNGDSFVAGSLLDDLARNNVENLASIVDIIDWLGYQLLSLDCGRNEIHSSYLTDDNVSINYHKSNNNTKVDVACLQVSGMIDYQYAQEEMLWNLLNPSKLDRSLILRALFLYSNIGNNNNCNNDDLNQLISNDNNIIEADGIMTHDNSGIVYLQDCSRGSKAANEITVIGMSALADC